MKLAQKEEQKTRNASTSFWCACIRLVLLESIRIGIVPTIEGPYDVYCQDNTPEECVVFTSFKGYHIRRDEDEISKHIYQNRMNH